MECDPHTDCVYSVFSQIFDEYNFQEYLKGHLYTVQILQFWDFLKTLI